MIESILVLCTGEDESFVVGRRKENKGIVGEIADLGDNTFVVYDDRGNRIYEVINCPCIISYKVDKNET